MQTGYDHTQRSNWMLVIFAIVILTLAGIWAATGAFVLAAPMVLLAVVPWAFSSLRVRVDEHELRVGFAGGRLGWRCPLQRVANVSPVRNRWWYGWGIRITPHGWLYNVSGLDAVEIELTSGRRFRVGTDQPQALAEAIRERLPAPMLAR